ncbi:uncharacterized protein VSU04_012133 isoform 2-T2 [Chlamydotis macqueenii]
MQTAFEGDEGGRSLVSLSWDRGGSRREHPTLLELSARGSPMDSPHFKQLCVLLLTVAAPHPNIALPSGYPAEGTQGSSFGKINVSVYHCKGCKSNICESSSYTGFEKILEIQEEKVILSSKIIQLANNETHIIMCLHQENTFPEGIYGIVWEKATGIGESCGIVNSGASSENVRGNITNTCCAAEINLSVTKLPLKCYTKMPDEKTGKSTADITEEGNPDNPQFLISKKSSLGFLIPLLMLVVCVVVLTMYYVRRKQNGQEQE